MREFKLIDYRADVERLASYLPWLEQKSGTQVSSSYTGSGINETSVPFPVYESTLLSFVKEAQNTGLIDTNYPYVYSELFIKTHGDEFKAIERADVKTGAILCAILSKYVLGGMTKGNLWSEAVKEGIFLAVVKRMKEIVEHWDGPFEVIESE
ncbi:MAG: hypothetical protein IKR39_07645 [Lachnospiraceae bacterium]|nr:hypothetical protein [Lachnospiraceae bacterium]